MAELISASLPIIVGLIFVAIAVLERGYKTFLDAKKVDPTIKFGGAYLLNLLVTTGASSAIVIAVIPALLTGLGTVPAEITLSAIILQAILGYETAYRILDGLNTSTEKKETIAELTKATTKP